MKQLKDYIIEKLHISKYKKKYNYHPKNKSELQNLLFDLFKERGDCCDLNDIDTSDITDMSFLFQTSDYLGDISDWDVSKVKSMDAMFSYVKSKFNKIDFSKWDVSNVKDMNSIFAGWKDFEGKGIENWDMSNVEDCGYMFNKCINFNVNISKWKFNKVRNMKHMFDGCSKFNQNLTNWDIQYYVEIENIFKDTPIEDHKPLWAED